MVCCHPDFFGHLSMDTLCTLRGKIKSVLFTIWICILFIIQWAEGVFCVVFMLSDKNSKPSGLDQQKTYAKSNLLIRLNKPESTICKANILATPFYYKYQSVVILLSVILQKGFITIFISFHSCLSLELRSQNECKVCLGLHSFF